MKNSVASYIMMLSILSLVFLCSGIAQAEDARIATTSDTSSHILNLLLDDGNWVKKNTSHDITHFSKKIENSSFKAYKGVCTIESPMDLLYSILCDVQAHTKWIKYCDSSMEVERPTPNQSIQYYTFDIPWPFCDRDVVVNCHVESDWDAGRVVIKSVAIKNPRNPVPVQKKLSRVTNSEQIWVLERLSSSKTRVTFLSYAKMDGLVPKLLNNLISSVIPSQSLANLKLISSGKHNASPVKYLAEIH